MLEPITIEEMKLHLRIDSAEDNALISALITAARTTAENFTRRTLMTQTFELVYDGALSSIEIPRPPLQEIKKIETIDEDGVRSEVDPASYYVDISGTSPGRVSLRPGYSWPEHRGFASFLITGVAGYGSAPESVPAPIREAIKKLVAEMYESRGGSDILLGTNPLTNQQQLIMAILAPYRVIRL